MQTNIYPTHKSWTTILLYGNIAIFSLVAYLVQREAPSSFQFVFLSVFLLEVITVTELFDTKAGLFAIGVSLLFEVFLGNFNCT